MASSSKNKNQRQYTDGEIDMIREHFKQSLLKTKIEPEYETFPDDWCVYSWDNGNQIESMHPHDALILELQGYTVTNMTEKHGMRPAHLKKVEREQALLECPSIIYKEDKYV